MSKIAFGKKLSNYLLASLAIHLMFVLIMNLKDSKPNIKNRPVEIVYGEPPPPLSLKTSDETQKKIVKAKKQEKQIVEQDERKLNDEKDNESQFLSRHTQKVVKQTVATTRDEFRNLDQQTKGFVEKSKKPALDFKSLNPTFDIKKIVEQKQLEESDFEARQPNPDRKPAVKGSASLDYIKNVDPGLETLLSTQEFKFYNYYSRVRTKLNQHWSDDIKARINKLYKTGRWIASSEDRVTKLLVTLDTTGNLVKVQIIGDSGLRDLDEAAVNAFKKAAPFLNPPKDMVDTDGTIKLRWDFVLEA